MANNDILWLAGILEGEGSFTLSFQYKKLTPRIQLGMTDKDVVEKVAKILGSKVTTLKRKTNSGKEIHVTSLARKPELKIILESILPYMGNRRTLRINELLGECHS